jgi:hypothetical protein
VQKALSVVFSDVDGIVIETSGIYVDPLDPWLAASCDGELRNGPAPGNVELKVQASSALQWLEDKSLTIPDPPWGLHAQPPHSPPWEVLSKNMRFEPAPKEWTEKNLGPAKAEHFTQINIQMHVLLSLGKKYTHMYYCVWHPGTDIRIYRTTHHHVWMRSTLIPMYRLSYWSEFFPVAVEIVHGRYEKSRSVDGTGNAKTVNPDTDDAGGNSIESTLLDEAIDDLIDLSMDVDTPETPADDDVVVGSMSAEDIELYSKSFLLSIGPWHNNQCDLKSLAIIFESELLALVLKSGCDPWAASSPKRLGFLLGVGSVNKFRELVFGKILPGVLLFFLRCYYTSTGTVSSVHTSRFLISEWIDGIKCPALQRLNALLRSIVGLWAKHSADKSGGLYVFRHMVAKYNVELKAAAARGPYCDLHSVSMVQILTSSPKEVAALLKGSDVDFGSHVEGSDLFLESCHSVLARINPPTGQSGANWLKRTMRKTGNSNKPNSAFFEMGTKAPSENGVFGEIQINAGAAEVERFLSRSFGNDFNIPPPNAAFLWRDCNGKEHNSAEDVDIGGFSISLPANDIRQTGRAWLYERLRTGIFGQSSEASTDGHHSSKDANPDNFDTFQAFGSSVARVSGSLPTQHQMNEAMQKRELQRSARSQDDIKRAYYRESSRLRSRLKRYQNDLRRPQETKVGGLWNAEGGKIENIAGAVALWLNKHAAFCEIVDAEWVDDGADSLEPKSFLQIQRHVSTRVRQDEARRYLALIGSEAAHTTVADTAPEFNSDIKKACPEADFVSFLEKHDLDVPKDSIDTNSCVTGGKKWSAISVEFDDIDDAAFDVFDALSPLKASCKNSKAKEMHNFTARQEHDIIDFLQFRKRNAYRDPTGSFWANKSVIPPASSGTQCSMGIDRYVADMDKIKISHQEQQRGAKRAKHKKKVVFSASDYNTYTVAQLKEACQSKGFCHIGNAQTLRRYLLKPEKAKLAYDPTDKNTWTNDELRIYLSQHGKVFSGNHETLVERSKDLESAPRSRKNTKVELYRAMTTTGLREELKTRGMPFEGTKNLLILRLIKSDSDMASELSEFSS